MMTEQNALQDEFFTQIARVGKAVSSPARLRILFLLTQGEKTVESVATQAALSVANASQHLQQLKGARMVVSRKDGQKVNYSVAAPTVETLWRSLQDFGQERLLEIQEIAQLNEKKWGHVATITHKDLLEKLKKNSVAIVDVRPAMEFEWAHLPGAVSIPLPELKKRVDDLPKKQDVVAYCRGPLSHLSAEAVILLKGKGFKARRLVGGFPEWKAEGHPIEGGSAARK